MYQPKLEHMFDSMGEQRHAARLGMWIFMGSEVLFFSALFVLYAGYRTQHPEIFAEAVRHNSLWIGSLNTALLVLGSTSLAVGVNALRGDRRRLAVLAGALTCVLGAIFLTLKGVEYARHFQEGIFPGEGAFFAEHPQRGFITFFSLYFAMTGLHAVHVIAGLALVGWMTGWVIRQKVGAAGAYRFEMASIYWSFIDVIWIFLWACFYLMGDAS